MTKSFPYFLTVLFLGLASCQSPASTSEIATSVKNQLTSPGPSWAGSVWRTSSVNSGDSIVELTTVFDTLGSTNVQKVFPLTASVWILSVNVDGTFSLTQTVTNDANNFGKTFLPDNYYWSSDSLRLVVPALVTTGMSKTYKRTVYGDSAAFFVNGKSGYLAAEYSLPQGCYTIGATGSTTYNGTTLYPVTYKTANGAGKTASVMTVKGTWGTFASQNPLVGAQALVLKVAEVGLVNYSYTAAGSVAATTTTTAAVPAEPQVMYSTADMNPDTGLGTFSVQLPSFLSKIDVGGFILSSDTIIQLVGTHLYQQ